jgi:hypothetical protein
MAQPSITSVDLKFCLDNGEICQQNQTDGNLITKWSAGGRIVLSWSHQFTLSDPEPPHLPAYDYTPGKPDGSTYILNFSIGVASATVSIKSSLAFNLTYDWGSGIQAPSSDMPHESPKSHFAYIDLLNPAADGSFLDITISAVPGGHVDVESNAARQYYIADPSSTATAKRRVTFDNAGPWANRYSANVIDFVYLMTAAPTKLTTIGWSDALSAVDKGSVTMYRMDEGSATSGLRHSDESQTIQLAQERVESSFDNRFVSSFSANLTAQQQAFFSGPNLYSFEFNIVDTVGNHRLQRRLALFADDTGVQHRDTPIRIFSAGTTLAVAAYLDRSEPK